MKETPVRAVLSPRIGFSLPRVFSTARTMPDVDTGFFSSLLHEVVFF